MAMVYFEREEHLRGNRRRHEFVVAKDYDMIPLSHAANMLLELEQTEKFARDPSLRRAVIRGLRHVPTDQTFELLQRLSQDGQKSVRRTAAFAYCEFLRPESMDALERLAQDPTEDVRAGAVKGIGYFLNRAWMYRTELQGITREQVEEQALRILEGIEKQSSPFKDKHVLQAMDDIVHEHLCGSSTTTNQDRAAELCDAVGLKTRRSWSHKPSDRPGRIGDIE